MTTTMESLFPLGQISVTEMAQHALRESQQSADEFVERHSRGDWGDVADETRAHNDAAVSNGERIESVYHTSTGEKVLVVTDPDRALTTVLLPVEF